MHKLVRWSQPFPNKHRHTLAAEHGRNFFFLLGLLALGYVGYVWVAAQQQQAELSARFEQARRTAPVARTASQPLPVREGALLGRLEIKRLGLSVIVQEGVNESTLRQAVGHLPGTPLPGQRGNVALAGHRDTFFRELRNIQPADEILLTTLDGTERYQVDSLRVVAPTATEVLAAAEDDWLTLVTCYPFNFIGPAPQRFIVRARKIQE